jgi:hypothetical protein
MRRGFVFVAALSIGACASIAGLNGSDPPAEDEVGSSSGKTSSSSGRSSTGSAGNGSSSTSSGTSSGSTTSSSGAPIDAGEDVKQPPPNGGPCKGGNKCDNPEQVCAEDKFCRDVCRPEGTACDFDEGQCCFGTFCPFDFGNSCQKCIDDDKPAARFGFGPASVPMPRSCCSGKADTSIGGDGKCKK